ncbi:MAG TPA: M12 family metallopeptidase [Sphingomicrobium sp.]|nr:M12 family metallopeptidase [Sphingomicrobium sp.]
MAAAGAALILLLAGYFWPRNETKTLQDWVEKQNFIFLVPARGGFLPGDIVQWPAAAPDAPRSGDVMLYERSARVLGPSAGGLFQETGPYDVTITDTIDAGLRSGALPARIGAEARAKGVQSFELVMKDIMILEAPLASLQQAVAGQADLAAALRDPNRTVITRILRPTSFEYRFRREGQTGFAASLQRMFGHKGKEAVIESGGTFVSSTRMQTKQPLVVGIAIASFDLRNVGESSPSPTLRKLGFEEGRALQPGANAALWPAGSTIRVRFLNGGPAERQLFEESMGEWLKYANLHVSYVRSGDSDIRAKFANDGASWSYVGRNAQQRLPDEPTIWLGHPIGDAWARTAFLHEIGHSLGLVHEFQNPQAQQYYNRDALMAYFQGTMHMSGDQISKMFFDTAAYPGSRPVDFNSVMSFPLPPRVLRNGKSFVAGNELSQSDRAYIAQLYAREG